MSGKRHRLARWRPEPNNHGVRIFVVAVAVLLAGCVRSASMTAVVVEVPSSGEVLVRTDESLSPGDVVHVWHNTCSSRTMLCRYRLVANGVVTEVMDDTPPYARVQFLPGTAIAVGDRAVKDSPMFYWHPDPPSD
jgi:hypothetical protein